jgi:formylglycine-generating enzyme required for sulfatase activity
MGIVFRRRAPIGLWKWLAGAKRRSTAARLEPVTDEAEWEYAARAGSLGSRYGELNEVAWYSDNSGGETHRARP